MGHVSDVLRNLTKHTKVFRETTFADVPDERGVYAWFYPLRIFDEDVTKFLDDVRKVQLFDARSGGRAISTRMHEFAWSSIESTVTKCPGPQLSDCSHEHWTRIIEDSKTFDNVRRAVLSASLLANPLYVGKTKSLLRRCGEHRRGYADSGFKQRFESYAAEEALHTQSVDQLLFTCIEVPTSRDPDEDTLGDSVETVVEEILKRVCQPPYGKV